MTNHLNIKVVDSPEDAPHYNRDMVDVRAATITQVIVVKKGTVEGRSTVDFQFTDQQGAQYVAMITGTLILQLASVIKGAEDRP